LPDAALFADLFPDAPTPAPRRGRAKSKGQGLVEFALITPVLVGILMIAADFGRAFTAYIEISGAAREGASYGSISTANSTNTGSISSAALADAPTIWGVAPTVSSTTGTDSYGYSYVQVTVNYTFTPLTTVWPMPSSVAMTRVVRMRVIN
jgi:Flp pilus assembly protein TadG